MHQYCAVLIHHRIRKRNDINDVLTQQDKLAYTSYDFSPFVDTLVAANLLPTTSCFEDFDSVEKAISDDHEYDRYKVQIVDCGERFRPAAVRNNQYIKKWQLMETYPSGSKSDPICRY